MKKNILLLIFTLFLSGNLTLTAQIRQANSFFDQFKYSKAVPLYKKALKNKDEKIRELAIVRLGDCYREMNDAEAASFWYTKAVQLKDADPVNYYYLGMSLRTLANYTEAEKAFLSYSQKVPSDMKGKIYAGYCNEISEWKAFSPCAEVKNAGALNSVYADFGSVFYKDALIFTSDRDIDLINDQNYQWTSYGYLDLYSALPLIAGDFWNGTAVPMKLSNAFNQSYHDGPASFTSDYKEIFTTRTLKEKLKKGTENIQTDYLKIYCADLSDEKKVSYQPFPYNSDTYSTGHPAISADGKKLIFSSDRPGGNGSSDLYISELIGGKWSSPVSLGPELNTFGNEVFPFFANDSTLFFSSDGHPGYGGLDIYETKLVHGKWTTPWNLKLPVNSPYDDFSIIFSKNLTDGFFSSNRPDGNGSDDIYVFRNYKRTPVVEANPVIPEKIIAKISGYLKDKKTLAPLDSATVFILNLTTGEVLVSKTDAKGYFEAPAQNGVQYIVKGMKPNFFGNCMSFSFSDEKNPMDNQVPRDLMLDKYALNQVFKIENIYYDLNKWLVREDARPSLDKLVRILKQNPIIVELGSHTDCRASSAYNDNLSQKRAESAVNYLIEKGIDPKRLTYKGYGETQLINKCADGVPCTDAEHQANRRTEFKVTSINASVAPVSIDLESFKTGDKIPVEKLGPDFFKDCM